MMGTDSFLFWLVVAGLGALWLWRQKPQPAWNMRLFAAEGDEDMKIATEHFPTKSREDASEQAARSFLRHKDSGNIDKARELGKAYAKVVIELDKGPLATEMRAKAMLIQHHLYLLYTYVVNRVIAECSPDSILAQTSLNVFFSEVEHASEDLYRHISDTAAFSLYILCERSQNRSDSEIGIVFAELCGAEQDSDMIDYGNNLFQKLYAFCKEQILAVPYAAI